MALAEFFSGARRADASQSSIVIDGECLPVMIRRHPRARSLRLRYDGLTGQVRITIPPHVSDRRALLLARENSDWLRAERARAISPIALVNGASLAFEGHERTIEWRRDWPRLPQLQDASILLGGEERSIPTRLTQWLKAEARGRFEQDLRFYCARAGAALPDLSVGDARTRWGSCSSRGAVRLNWRLIMAPAYVRRSVVAHEVAHLRHMDHSRKFYAHLDRIFEDDLAAADNWLRQNGAGLRAVGAKPGLSIS